MPGANSLYEPQNATLLLKKVSLCVKQERWRARGLRYRTFWSAWRGWIFWKREIQTLPTLEVDQEETASIRDRVQTLLGLSLCMGGDGDTTTLQMQVRSPDLFFLLLSMKQDLKLQMA